MKQDPVYKGGCFCGAVKLTVLRVRDGLPKLRDVPRGMGGSGESIDQ